MFSNDKNVETIGQLVETIKHYIGLQKEYLKLDVVDKVVPVVCCGFRPGQLVGNGMGILHRGSFLHSPLALIRCQQAPMDRETFCQISCQPTPEIALSLMVNS